MLHGKTVKVYGYKQTGSHHWYRGDLITTFSMLEWCGNGECFDYVKSLFDHPVWCVIQH
jgi:hypothetical protein